MLLTTLFHQAMSGGSAALASGPASMITALPLDQFQHAVLWTLIVGAVLAFVLGFGMGANDVSNAFGTSVGSRVLTMKQAYILATIFETLGAVLVGYNVTDTMRRGVVDVGIYADEPRLFIYGQLAILAGCSAWLLIATYASLPVSTTHSVVGATIGFSLSCKWTAGIHWWEVGRIAASWVLSPLLSGTISTIFYLIVDIVVLRRRHPLRAGLKAMPVFFFCCLTFNTFAVSYQGSKVLNLSTLPLWLALVISLAVGFASALAVHYVMRPRLVSWIQRRNTINSLSHTLRRGGNILTHPKQKGGDDLSGFYVITHPAQPIATITTCGDNGNNMEHGLIGTPTNHNENGDLEAAAARRGAPNQPTHGSLKYPGVDRQAGRPRRIRKTTIVTAEGETDVDEDVTCPSAYLPQELESFHPKALLRWLLPARERKEDKKTLRLFSSVQVFTACFAGFAHGANDVSNAIAPLTALLAIYNTQSVTQAEPTPIPVLLYGVVAICVGLCLLGHRVITTVGQRMSHIHPASGFTIELGAAVTALLASKLGLPISTTHCLVGSVVCVGCVKAGEGIRWAILKNVVLSWVVTLPISGAIAAATMLLLKLLFV